MEVTLLKISPAVTVNKFSLKNFLNERRLVSTLKICCQDCLIFIYRYLLLQKKFIHQRITLNTMM